MPEEVQEWSPSIKQEKFLSLPYEIFEGLYGGAAFGGKTEVIGLVPLTSKCIGSDKSFIDHPRFKGLLLRRTFPELEREIIPRMMPFYESSGASWNGTKRSWTWPSGARIFAGHIEHESDVRKYDTDEYNYVGWDELTSFTEFQYLYLTGSRCRSSVSDLPAFTRAGTNPGNIGNTWVRNRWQVDKVPSGTIIRDKLTNKLRTFIQALPTDNTKVPKERLKEYLDSLELLPEAEKRAKKYADWNAFEGQVFTEYRIKHVEGEPENAVHIIDPFTIPDYWPKILAIDWGFAALAYALWGAISPFKRVYAFREYGVKKTYIEHWASEISRLSQYDNIVSVVIDPSAKQNRGEKKTIFQQVSEGLGDKLSSLLHVADNDRISGKMLLHEYLRFIPRPIKYDVTAHYDEQVAMQILRLKGMEEYYKYINQFKPDEPDDIKHLPKLQIFDTCPLLKEVISSCVYDENRKEDVKEFDGDDPYDDVRYLLKEVDAYVNDSARAFEKQKKHEEIEKTLEETQDYNQYFMNLRRERAEELAEVMAVPNLTRVRGRRVGR
jgi:hypothetical protein